MINPSNTKWIEKYLYLFDKVSFHLDFDEFYSQFKDNGVIYGLPIPHFAFEKNQLIELTHEEKSKLNLLHGLYIVFRLNNKKDAFIESCICFFDSINKTSDFNFYPLNFFESPNTKLESLLHKAVQTNENLFSKYFLNNSINSLFFIYILKFDDYLKTNTVDVVYYANFQETLLITLYFIEKKEFLKYNNDSSILSYFDFFLKNSSQNKKSINELQDINLTFITKKDHKIFFLDFLIFYLTINNSFSDDNFEKIKEIINYIKIDFYSLENEINFISNFISNNKNQLPKLKNDFVLKNVYDDTSKLIIRILKRNKKRLINEITESKELMSLLTQSTKRNLTEEEKKKIKNQLLDICKSIPSLAIFALPGGSIVLPILLKFIPSLLPSSFNENTKFDV